MRPGADPYRKQNDGAHAQARGTGSFYFPKRDGATLATPQGGLVLPRENSPCSMPPPTPEGWGETIGMGVRRKPPDGPTSLEAGPAGTTLFTRGSSRPLSPTMPTQTEFSLSYNQPLEGGREGEDSTLSVRPQGAADGLAAAP